MQLTKSRDSSPQIKLLQIIFPEGLFAFIDVVVLIVRLRDWCVSAGDTIGRWREKIEAEKGKKNFKILIIKSIVLRQAAPMINI